MHLWSAGSNVASRSVPFFNSILYTVFILSVIVY